jgi:hypothetical protein
MRVAELLKELRERSVCLSVEGKDIRWTAPPNSMNVDDVRRIKGEKPALLRVLTKVPAYIGPVALALGQPTPYHRTKPDG